LEPANLLNPFVLAYFLLIAVSQLAVILWRRRASEQRMARRRAVGLDDGLIMSTTSRLETQRRDALIDAGVLLTTVIVLPFLLWGLAGYVGNDAREGLGLAFVVLLIWVLFTASDVGKAFIGGLAFRTLLAFSPPFQVGDRVTLKGHGGRVASISPFYIRLVTPGDDLVSVPTSSLWTETLVSSNAGDRASLCIMPFYIAPFATKAECEAAENAIWDAVQASTMFDFSKPVQIYVEQTDNAVRLTAKAYVANTYEEPLFKSDVTRAFLTWAADNDIPLASTRWREERKYLETKT
jgi:small-conductance mechanosensitive channel